jgi:hypothetical protein
MRMIAIALATACLFTSCAHDTWIGPHTAGEYYSSLHGGSRQVFSSGYDFGANDTMQRLYQSERNLQRFDVPGGPSKISLQTKLVRVPVAPYVDSSGQIRDTQERYVTLHIVQ